VGRWIDETAKVRGIGGGARNAGVLTRRPVTTEYKKRRAEDPFRPNLSAVAQIKRGFHLERLLLDRTGEGRKIGKQGCEDPSRFSTIGAKKEKKEQEEDNGSHTGNPSIGLGGREAGKRGGNTEEGVVKE